MADQSSSSAAASDRRDSARVPQRLLVREAALGGSFEEREGHLSLWGVDFDALHPPAGGRFEVRFLLPGVREEIRAHAELLRVSREGERFGAHLRFLDLPLEAELAIARALQG
ncbi:MAG TPA: PilZ domain-containing protein [Anaeromyxobacter sp.]|nr:PilZ domain-containing protein [Anaeromyxobacter sp.]